MTTGYFSVDAVARTARGRLLPYDVRSMGTSSSNTAPITFRRGDVAIPRDPVVIGLNDEHERFSVMARAVELVDSDSGIDAVFSFADTDEADRWLAEHPDGAYFSAEVAELRRLPGDFGVGRLAGAAATDAPAFAGTEFATFSLVGEEEVVAQLDDEEDEETTAEEASPVEEEPDEEPDETQEEDMGDAVAPGTFSRRSTPAATTAPRLTKAGFFSAVHAARTGVDPHALAPYLKSIEEVGLFALSNVAYDGAAGLTTLGGFPADWLGELAGGERFARTVIPLLTQKPLKSLKAHGWKWETKPTMAAWTGNKTPIPSNAPTVGPAEFDAVRYAGGHDLAREYYDFNVTEVIESYIEAMVDSYYVLSDEHALVELEAGATAFTPTASSVSGQLAQMARAVLSARVRPTFALVGVDVFDAFTDVVSSDTSAYFSPTINLADGDLKGIPLIPDDRLDPTDAIVGSKSAATVWELPGVPIRVSAPDLVLGGYDEAFFGYVGAGVEYPAGVQKANIVLPVVGP